MSSAAPSPVVLRTRGGHTSGGPSGAVVRFLRRGKVFRCGSRLFSVSCPVSLCPRDARGSCPSSPRSWVVCVAAQRVPACSLRGALDAVTLHPRPR